MASIRGDVECVAMVTTRFRPFKVRQGAVHQVGLALCYWMAHAQDGGESANLLTPSVGDPNTMIPESKAFMVNVEKV